MSWNPLPASLSLQKLHIHSGCLLKPASSWLHSQKEKIRWFHKSQSHNLCVRRKIWENIRVSLFWFPKFAWHGKLLLLESMDLQPDVCLSHGAPTVGGISLQTNKHASIQKAPSFSIQMRTSVCSTFGLDCRGRGILMFSSWGCMWIKEITASHAFKMSRFAPLSYQCLTQCSGGLCFTASPVSFCSLQVSLEYSSLELLLIYFIKANRDFSSSIKMWSTSCSHTTSKLMFWEHFQPFHVPVFITSRLSSLGNVCGLLHLSVNTLKVQSHW